MEKAQRLISLDVLRGITIAGMIIVNNPGSWKHVYTPLTHAVWNGLTPTDLVFPFFMFIMGMTGTYDAQTSAAIARIQRAWGLEDTGNLDRETFQRLAELFCCWQSST